MHGCRSRAGRAESGGPRRNPGPPEAPSPPPPPPSASGLAPPRPPMGKDLERPASYPRPPQSQSEPGAGRGRGHVRRGPLAQRFRPGLLALQRRRRSVTWVPRLVPTACCTQQCPACHAGRKLRPREMTIASLVLGKLRVCGKIPSFVPGLHFYSGLTVFLPPGSPPPSLHTTTRLPFLIHKANPYQGSALTEPLLCIHPWLFPSSDPH